MSSSGAPRSSPPVGSSCGIVGSRPGPAGPRRRRRHRPEGRECAGALFTYEGNSNDLRVAGSGGEDLGDHPPVSRV
uniref:Uncharacterized protein n=1 Tax=Junco hyemalis TaxID=40217 RepID=A0A8C5J0U0_JUNHY